MTSARARARRTAAPRVGVLERGEALERARRAGRSRSRHARSPSASSARSRSASVATSASAPPRSARRPAAATSSAASGVGRSRDRPRAVADPVRAPQAPEEHPQAPVLELVAEEEQVAAAESRGERDRQERGRIGVREVVDVVVLADDVAVARPAPTTPPWILRITVAPRASARARRSAPRRSARSRPARGGGTCPRSRPNGDVRDDVELLADVGERVLERRSRTRRSRAAGAGARIRRAAARSSAIAWCTAAGAHSARTARPARRTAGRRPAVTATYCETRARSRPALARAVEDAARWSAAARPEGASPATDAPRTSTSLDPSAARTTSATESRPTLVAGGRSAVGARRRGGRRVVEEDRPVERLELAPGASPSSSSSSRRTS